MRKFVFFVMIFIPAIVCAQWNPSKFDPLETDESKLRKMVRDEAVIVPASCVKGKWENLSCLDRIASLLELPGIADTVQAHPYKSKELGSLVMVRVEFHHADSMQWTYVKGVFKRNRSPAIGAVRESGISRTRSWRLTLDEAVQLLLSRYKNGWSVESLETTLCDENDPAWGANKLDKEHMEYLIKMFGNLIWGFMYTDGLKNNYALKIVASSDSSVLLCKRKKVKYGPFYTYYEATSGFMTPIDKDPIEMLVKKNMIR